MKKLIVVLLTACLFSINIYSYGPRGHQLVGAIADKRLAKNPTVAAKVHDLLDGMTLARAATLPDEIKGWGKCSNGTVRGRIAGASNRINRELRAFVRANLCEPSHNVFHYTDVPVTGGEKYSDGEIGRGDFDIVKMIPFCIQVLKDPDPEPNDRAITKSIAIILLTHYLGDIHQPLHVGAEFFDANGDPFQPSEANKGFEDQGGNKLTLFTLMDGELASAGKFHGYWDSQTVENAFGTAQNSTVAKRLAKKEPADWRLTGGVESWAEELANGILPLASEAHTRLRYANIRSNPGDREISGGRAEERKQPGGRFYALWAADVVKSEIHKGGWRLSALLEEVLE